MTNIETLYEQLQDLIQKGDVDGVNKLMMESLDSLPEDIQNRIALAAFAQGITDGQTIREDIVATLDVGAAAMDAAHELEKKATETP